MSNPMTNPGAGSCELEARSLKPALPRLMLLWRLLLVLLLLLLLQPLYSRPDTRKTLEAICATVCMRLVVLSSSISPRQQQH